jgi:adenine phosphoribosyltransferase
MNDLKSLIREVPDFPKPGINFFDITTLMKDGPGLRRVFDALYERYKGQDIGAVIGIEARGYFFAPAVAYALGVGFIPVRKPGKLPAKTVNIEYALEYGTDKLEMHADGVQSGDRILIIDDVLATGGTASAVTQLVERQGGTVAGLGFVIELDFLAGRDKLTGYDIFSLLHY